MTRTIVFCIILLTIFSSCSKEEEVPFIKEDRDTITPTSYLNLSGKYSGTIKHIEFFNDSAYEVISTQKHSISIEELDFDLLLINNVTNFTNVNVETKIAREIWGVYMQMDDSKLPPSVGSIPVINVDLEHYNGILLFSNPKEVEYFIYITDMVDTVQQVFNGTLIE